MIGNLYITQKNLNKTKAKLATVKKRATRQTVPTWLDRELTEHTQTEHTWLDRELTEHTKTVHTWLDRELTEHTKTEHSTSYSSGFWSKKKTF